MTLLLTILSVLALWAFLTVLVIGLLLILKSLELVRGRLEKVTMGVRAIEWETKPLGPRLDAVAGSLGQAGNALGGVAHHLADVDRDLDAAAAALRPRG